MMNWIEHLATRAQAPMLDATTLARGFVAPVTDQGLIAVAGEDAATFLHSLLTNDVLGLTANEARLAGFCTPKGRLQASFLLWRSALATDTIYLQLPASIQPALQKRLSMYVLRSKAKLRDATHEAPNGAALCIGGGAGQAALDALGLGLPDAPMGKTEAEFGTVIRLADAFGAPRYLWLTSSEQAAPALERLGAQLAVGTNQAWQLSAIHAGQPQIDSATQEKFVPQMVNFDLLDGINFKKGCYPGQEIVARTKYLGTIKRRTMLASTTASASAGDEVFGQADPLQPCGMVVNSAPNGEAGSDLLIELKLANVADALSLGSADGAPVRLLAMPYAIDAIED